MAGSLKNIGLTSLDDLFKTDEQRQADAQERVQIVPADQVFPYARQPYSIDRPTQDLAQLMDSIERVGIAEPLIVRPRDGGGYEIIAGHRRDYCAKTIGLETRPVIVREYLRDEKDVLKLIDNLIKNTTPRNASSNDPFWEKAEIALDSALMLYLMSEAPPEEQNFETMLFMMEYAEVREEDEGYRSPLDLLFQALEEEQPNHVAVKQYKVFKQAAGKTAKSILISAAVRLAAFNIPQYAAMTARDDMDFGSLGERKRAIFCVIPINDASMNYLIGMLYTQCFQELYYRADEKYNGRLPVPVRVIQDEWANVAQPDSYPKILATCRSYNIGLNIIVQNIQNIKALYEKEWEGIIGNCDTLLFLGGGNEPTSLEFMSKLLGKETLDTRTRGQTKGRNGSSSTNYQQAGRELMMIDEIRMMDTDDAILLIRGEKPVLDKKYDITRHPNFKKSAAGGAEPYVHKPQEAPDYALPDLPYEFHALDDYDFIEMEDSQNEQEE